ncbi:aromatic amino acid transaminase [Dinoroseobacter sp. S124A]|uniref:amino acid aminotransferase n=1 Tax=Dinoroseobacter sp. S124A TaxID=3415128 RepID=UPI003C7D1A27
MFERLTPTDPDAILALMQAFQADPRPGKVDLGIGVWRDAEGRTPVFSAVKRAEKRIWKRQETKTYVSFRGDAAFHEAVSNLLLGPATDGQWRAASATTGGTSAVQTALTLARAAHPDLRVWIPAETWPNHWVLARSLGLETRSFAYIDPDTQEIDRAGLLRDLDRAQAGDVVLLHACCHNPTGADPDAELQAAIVASLARTGAVPVIDCAYLGFGATPEEDCAFLRRLSTLPEVLIAFSGSKSFGLYRERVGLCLALADGPQARDVVENHLTRINRVTYSFPPDHGARTVTEILGDQTLRAEWQDELGSIRDAITTQRARLAEALRTRLNTDRFDRLTRQKGMFAMLPLGEARVAELRNAHGIYIVGAGRINMAGVTEETCATVADALAAVLR